MSFGSFRRRGQRDQSQLKISGNNQRVFELWSLENRLFPPCRTFFEETDRIGPLLTTQFPVLISEFDLESVNFFFNSAANLCGKDGNRSR